MASGVSVCDHVIRTFNDMKVRKTESSGGAMGRMKAIMFCLNGPLSKIVVDEERRISCKDIGVTIADPLKEFIKLFPLNDCRYALYDMRFRTKETQKEELIFIFWSPDAAPLKHKLVYAASKEALKKVFTGLKHEWQVNSIDDIQDRRHFRELLRAPDVVSIEGIEC